MEGHSCTIKPTMAPYIDFSSDPASLIRGWTEMPSIHFDCLLSARPKVCTNSARFILLRLSSPSAAFLLLLPPVPATIMSKLVELSGSDLTVLQTRLDQLNPPMESLPLRQQLWYILENVIPNGHVYVDHWPDFRNVCSLHTSESFSGHDCEFDMATFYQIGDIYDEKTFEEFVRALVSERKWTDRGLYGNYVQVFMIETIKRVLKADGKLDVYGAYSMYTGLERGNVDKYRQRLDALAAKLPNELEPDILRSCDVEKVIQEWHYGPPEVTPRLFQWLLKTFPSMCLRNRRRGNVPVAWACSYSCGAMANIFVEEGYRGTGLSEYIWLSIALKLSDFTPLQPYFNITPGNAPSEKSAEKAFRYDMKKGTSLTSWFFFFDRKHYDG